jgi:hypothetical protein
MGTSDEVINFIHSRFKLEVVSNFVEEDTEFFWLFKVVGYVNAFGRGELSVVGAEEEAIIDIEVIILHAEDFFQTPSGDGVVVGAIAVEHAHKLVLDLWKLEAGSFQNLWKVSIENLSASSSHGKFL